MYISLEREKNKAELLVLLSKHTHNCYIPECLCGRLLLRLEETIEKNKVVPINSSSEVRSHILNNLESREEEMQLIGTEKEISFKIIHSILNVAANRLFIQNRNTRSYMLSAYINYCFLDNMFLALYDLQYANSTNSSIYQELLIFKMR